MMTRITPGNKKKAGLGMGMSLRAAESISAFANVIFLGSLIIGVVAAFFIYITAGVKEAAFKRAIAELEVATAEANAAAEKARESAAMAQERAARLENETALLQRETARLRLQNKELERKSRKAPF